MVSLSSPIIHEWPAEVHPDSLRPAAAQRGRRPTGLLKFAIEDQRAASQHTLPSAPLRNAADDVVQIEARALSSVHIGTSPRSDGIHEHHVEHLMATSGTWPPIVVDGGTGTVIDGRHRVEAARRLGHDKIVCSLFQGSATDAFVESVRLNIRHGLPLTAGDRELAADRLLRLHPEWSDRRIAEICAISPGVVARVRAEVAATDDGTVQPLSDARGFSVRIGRDHRVRPVDARAQRVRIAEALTENPDASLRAIARIIGASPETVRSVRRNLVEESSPPPLTLVPHGYTSGARVECRTPPDFDSDRALVSSLNGDDFVNWLDKTQPTAWPDYVEVVPVSRIYGIVDEARTRAQEWTAFATALEERIRGRARQKAG